MSEHEQHSSLNIELMLKEPTIAKLTETAVADALQGFELTPKRHMSWIARAMQGALFTSIRPADESSARPSNAKVRKELLTLAGDCSKLWLRLCERSTEADGAIWHRAFRNWVAAKDEELTLPASGDPPDSRKFSEAVSHLEWLSIYLRKTADLERQPPNWRRAEERELRIVRAHHLSPIYEKAYGAEPTVNTWPSAKSLGPWADFYQRTVSLAFGERATPNLEAVLDEARRRDKAYRVSFGPGVIPK